MSESWLDIARRKRMSQYSPVVLIDSNDPRRVSEIEAYALKRGFNGAKSKNEVYAYSEWGGIGKLALTSDGRVSYERVENDESPIDALTGGGDLRRIDALAREKSATIVIHDVVNVPKELVAAMNAWSADGALLGKGATIIAFLSSDALNESIKSRMNNVRPPLSTSEERREIVDALAKASIEFGSLKQALKEEHVQAIVNATGGLDLNQVEGKLAETINEGRAFDLRAIKEAKSALFASLGLRVVESWPYGFESVGGYELLKQFVRDEVVTPLRMRERAAKYGIKPAKGMILFGPPGTGKTHFAKALSNEVGIPMVMISAADIFSKYVGESEQRVRAITERVEAMAPAILFVDEIDQLSMSRGSQGEGDSGTSRRTLNMLLSWLSEQTDVFVVGTTNTIEQIDQAFLRSGRFDLIAPMDFPDSKAREEIFRVQCEVVRKLPRSKLDYSSLANATEWATGSDIEEIVVKTAKVAMREDRDVVMDDFVSILDSYAIPVDKRREARKAMLRATEDVLRDRRWAEIMKRDNVDEKIDVRASRVRGSVS